MADPTDTGPGLVPEGLGARQRQLLARWLPDPTVVRDHSWGLTGTVVLEVESRGARHCVKAAPEGDHHLVRELRAHREWLTPWTDRHLAPSLCHADDSARILVTGWLPGRLVQGSGAETRADTYRQAGALLALMHEQGVHVMDPEHERRETARALAWLDRPHRIAAATVARVRAVMGEWPCPPTVLVPTHGDWQPRNWLVDKGTVKAIDFGRAALRPAFTDWSRLVVQQFATDTDLERAFADGYGSDPREDDGWRRHLLREAVSTTVWAHQVGDAEFEAQGQRMLAAALTTEPSVLERTS